MDEQEKISHKEKKDKSNSKSSNKKSKSNKKLKIVAIIIAAVIAALLIATGVYSAVTVQSPISAVQSIFTSNKKEICAKWQSQDNPGLNAYVFYDDGTYDSYLSNFNFDGTYTIKGNKIYLKNPETNKELTYRFSIHSDVLILTLIESDGEAAKDQKVTKYDKVDELNMKSLSDIIANLTTETTETTEQN